MESINEQNWQAEDLWDQDFMDVAIEALGRPGALGVTVFTEEDGLEHRTMKSFDPYRILVLEAIRAVEYMENTASLIRYHGLPAARGEFVIGTGAAIIGGLIALTIGVVILILCENDEIEIKEVCNGGMFLTIVGGIFFGSGIAVALFGGSITFFITGADGEMIKGEIKPKK